MRRLRVGITGASGFIGSALVRQHLAAGDVVRCLSRKGGATAHTGAVVMRGDLEAPDEGLARFADGLDVLYHCAGEVYRSNRMHAINVEGTRALLLAAEGRIGRWVQLSSIGVYGTPRCGVVAEETPLDPVGIYERSKADADTLVLEAARQGSLSSAVVLRPSIVFGPEMPNQSIAGLIRIIERGLFFFIGTPGASANYIHVSNVVKALVLCGASSEASGRVYNLSDWCTIEDFAAAIAHALGKPHPWLRLPELPVRAAVRTVGKLVPLPLTE
ncbi:MAG: NAD-dependent epimerase/dehydratase family protein, partial [Vicinamibacterales bacterium]